MHAHLNDVGTAMEVTIVDQDSAVVNISSATVREIVFKKPDGTSVTKTGVVVTDGTDGKMQHITVAGDLDVAGTWRIQGFVTIGSGSWSSDVDSFVVRGNLR